MNSRESEPELRLQPLIGPQSAEYWRTQFLVALSALSWAVGHIDGVHGGKDDNYASRTLERLSNPQHIVAPGRGR